MKPFQHRLYEKDWGPYSPVETASGDLNIFVMREKKTGRFVSIAKARKGK